VPTLLLFDASADPFWRMPEGFVAAIEAELARLPESWDIARCQRGADLPTALRQADAFVGWAFPPALMRRAPRLHTLHFLTAGVPAGWGALAEARPELRVTRSSGINADGVAEHGLFLMLALLRGVSVPALSRWEPTAFGEARAPARLRCGVVGAGPIGAELARLAQPLFAEVRVLSQTARPSLEARSPAGAAVSLGAVTGFEQAAEFFAWAHVLALVLPATPETERLYANTLFGALRSDVLLLNLGRGESLSEDALLAFLDANPRARFAADVAPVEPYPGDGPLYAHPRVLLTPHVAGRRAGVWDLLLSPTLDALRRGLGDP
jgi:phosphoglycerate dehydrogenase-like enzyme